MKHLRCIECEHAAEEGSVWDFGRQNPEGFLCRGCETKSVARIDVITLRSNRVGIKRVQKSPALVASEKSKAATATTAAAFRKV
jgi:hypothetical protein